MLDLGAPLGSAVVVAATVVVAVAAAYVQGAHCTHADMTRVSDLCDESITFCLGSLRNSCTVMGAAYRG